MTRIILTITFIASFNFAVYSQANDQNGIKKSFNNYKSCILNNKGEEALRFVNSQTIKYYTDILEAIKFADSSKINSFSVTDKMTVLSVRCRAAKEKILKMDGKDLFIYAIKNGMIGKNSVANNTIGKIGVDKNFAKAQLLVSGKNTPYYFHFYKENEEWKFDLTSLFPIADITFKEIIKNSGKSENEYLFMLLEFVTGKKQDAEIWKPLQ